MKHVDAQHSPVLSQLSTFVRISSVALGMLELRAREQRRRPGLLEWDTREAFVAFSAGHLFQAPGRHREMWLKRQDPSAGTWGFTSTGGPCSSFSAHRVQVAPSTTSSGTWEPGDLAKNSTEVWQLSLEGRSGQIEIRERQQLFGRGWTVKRVLKRPA